MSSPVQWLLSFLATLVLASPVAAQIVRMPSLEQVGEGGFGWSRQWMDVNGDGRDDFCTFAGSEATRMDCYLSDGTTFGNKQVFTNIGSGQDPQYIRWSDLNGDQRADFCRVAQAWGGSYVGWRLTCWMGPNYTTTVTSPVIPMRSTEYGGGDTASVIAEYYGLADVRNLVLGDVDGDGRADLCYIYTGPTSNDFRCHSSNVTNSTGGFVDTPSIKTGIEIGLMDYPRGFHDFNGDGFGDFCRVFPGGRIGCILGTANGLAGVEVATSQDVGTPYKEGAAFVDINGDGKTDYCRVRGSGANHYLACTVSNGIGWEATERMSPANITASTVGDSMNRWWVDINADGLPDYCRLAASATTSGAWDFVCRLSRGDGDGASTYAFGFSDVAVPSVEIGEYEGRGFCDATGTGLQTYCRLAVSQVGTSEICDYGMDYTQCWPVPVNSTSIVAGLVAPDSPTSQKLQAWAPLVTAYSDGLGSETRITYLPMTRREVYVRSGDGTWPRSLIVQPRSPIVYETRAWRSGDASEASSLTGIARYMFKDLRQDTWGGSRGFRERWIFTEGSNTLDHVIHYQGLGPSVDASSIENDAGEIGLVKYQERFAVASGLLPTAEVTAVTPSVRTSMMKHVANAVRALTGVLAPVAPTSSSPFMLLQSTANTLTTLQNLETKGRPYRYIGESEVRSYDWNGTQPIELPKVKTTTVLSGHGNVASLTQTTRGLDDAIWSKATTNTYGMENEASWLLGRLTKASVESTAPTVDAQLAANGPRSAGNSATASAMSSSLPTAPQPISPAALSAILQLLLED